MTDVFQYLDPIIYQMNDPIETDIREKIRSFEYIWANMGLVNKEYRRRKPHIIIYKFRKTYYEMKCKNKLREILWDRIRRPKIAEKYSPENLRILLQSMEDEDSMEEFDNIIEVW